MIFSILLGQYLIKIAAENKLLSGDDFIFSGSKITLDLPFESHEFLSHGWQSWSLTAWLDGGIQPVPSFPKSLQVMQVDPLYSNEKRPNGSWLGAIKSPEGNVLLVGALNLESHVILEGNRITGFYEHGGGNWFIAFGSEQDVFERYAFQLGKSFSKKKLRSTPRVWCSWYSLYKEISEKNLLKILNSLEDLPIDVFQIDDGWQKKIGDWEENNKFPSGMQFLANKIKDSGKRAGLWLAPLIVVPSSNTFRNHPDWLLKNDKGEFVQAGINWSEKLYALDTTHPEVLTWLSNLMQKVQNWGFDYIKLDFLYAGALPGKRYQNIPRETAFRLGLETMREALENAFLLTCGTPILPSLGLSDAIRVGPDVSDQWNLNLESRILNNYAVPGVQNALRTSLNRIWLKPIVNPDPDVVYFHSQNIQLTDQQKNQLINLAQICEFKAISDLPSWLSDTEYNNLRSFLVSEPTIKYNGNYNFLINGSSYDYSKSILFPPKLSWFEKIVQYVVGNLANLPIVLIIFDKFTSAKRRKYLKKHL
jgi:alpha-galactosidase